MAAPLTTGASDAVFSEFTNGRITADHAKAMGSEANTALDLDIAEQWLKLAEFSSARRDQH